MNTKPYIVWRRKSDGYIGCTVGMPVSQPQHFESLLECWDWDTARTFRDDKRQSREHRALVASWDRQGEKNNW